MCDHPKCDVEPSNEEAAVLANPEVSEAIRRTFDGTAEPVEVADALV